MMTKLRHMLLLSFLTMLASAGFAAALSPPEERAPAAAPHVRAGQMIDVLIEEENLRVIARATALASGQVGEVVRVRFEGSGRLLLVRIVAPGQGVIAGLKPEA